MKKIDNMDIDKQGINSIFNNNMLASPDKESNILIEIYRILFNFHIFRLK